MGKWAKAHIRAKRKGLTPKSLMEIPKGLKDDMTPDMPGESQEEKALRNRQAMELGKLDEEENRRIKSMFAGGGGRKLFRNARSSSAIRSAASGASGGGSSASSGSAGGSQSAYRGGRGATSALP